MSYPWKMKTKNTSTYIDLPYGDCLAIIELHDGWAVCFRHMTIADELESEADAMKLAEQWIESIAEIVKKATGR